MFKILNSTYILLAYILIGNISYGQINVSTNQNTQIFKDTTFANFEKKIDEYYANKHKIKNLKKKLKPINEKINLNNRFVSRININVEKKKLNIKKLEDSLSLYEKKTARLVKKSRKRNALQLQKDTTEIRQLMLSFEKAISKYNENIKKYRSQIGVKKKNNSTLLASQKSIQNRINFLNKPEIKQHYSNSKSQFQKYYKDSIGEFKFAYKKNNYLAFIADLNIHNIGMHLNYENTPNHNSTKFIKLGSVKTKLEQKEGKKVLMLTNGGMYTPENNPEGLLIADGKELEPIDLGSSNQMLNFYMMPNGVFYIDSIKAIIETSKVFLKKYSSNQISPEQATQSGPMLVINNKHHPAFNHGSSSKKLRSGVGIMKDGRVIFIISNNSITNFHDFGTIFKDVFGCQNALFLDGAISKMYTEKYKRKSLGGNFGPIISVREK